MKEIHIEVELFAGASEIVGQRSVALELPSGSTLHAVADELARLYPDLQALILASRWAIDHEFVEMEHGVSEKSMIAMIPPVSGG